MNARRAYQITAAPPLPPRERATALLSYILMACCLWSATALAAPPGGRDGERERALFRDLRCMVCEGQSIADSDAELAGAMRALVREKIAGGWSDARIKDFLRERYGDYILFMPPLAPRTYALWLGPAIVLLAGALMIGRMLARSSSRGPS